MTQIKANELRIGNLVYDKHGQLYEIGVNSFYCFRHPTMDGNPCGYQAIPITPEWLERFGFEKVGDGWQLDIEPKQYCLYSSEGKYVDLFVYSDEVGQTCRYIHQLQNIYFALTGNELTLKPKDDIFNTLGNILKP